MQRNLFPLIKTEGQVANESFTWTGLASVASFLP